MIDHRLWWGGMLILVVLFVGLLWLMGCSHLAQDSSQQVYISSEPSGATIYVAEMPQPELTPMALTLDPRRSYHIRVEKACHAPYTTTVRPTMGLATYGTLKVPVSQLDASIHAYLPPTCPPLVQIREGNPHGLEGR